MNVLSESDFSNGSLKPAGKTMVLFHASWCPYCKELMPSFLQFAQSAKVDTALVDISDFGSPLWDMFSIDAVPTAILFEGGVPVDRVGSTIGNGVSPGEFSEFASKTKSI